MTAPISSIAPPNSAGYTPAQLEGPGGALGKDEFLKLLVAQMKNQDPDKPMDGTQLATQLAQFSSVEQLLNISTALATQATNSTAMSAAITANAAMGAVGKTVTAVGSDVMIPATGTASVTVNVGGAGGSGTLEIYNAAGDKVGSRALGQLSGGKQTIDVAEAQAGLAAGHYTYAVKATDTNGAAVSVTDYTVGVVDGVQYTSAGPLLTLGPITVPFSSVVQVSK